MGRQQLALFAVIFLAGFGAGALAYRAGLLHMLTPLRARIAETQQDATKTYASAHRGVHEAFPAKGRYVMLGDSITEHMTRWREAFPGAGIVNLGISGDTTTGVLKRLETVVATGAETVFILIGINDLQFSGATPAEVATRHTEIRRQLIQAGMHVVVMSIFTGEPRLRGQVAAVNALLEKSCQAPGCTFIDLNSTMSDAGVLKPIYTYDRLHLNAAGYKAWVGRISSLIK